MWLYNDMEIGTMGKRILREYNININFVDPREFYQRILKEADEIRSRLVRELIGNIPDALIAR